MLVISEFPDTIFRIRKATDENYYVTEIERALKEVPDIYCSSFDSFDDQFEAMPRVVDAPALEFFDYIREVWPFRRAIKTLVDYSRLDFNKFLDFSDFYDLPIANRPKLLSHFRNCVRFDIQRTRAAARVACFTEEILDARMWSQYGGKDGFAMEFKLPANIEKLLLLDIFLTNRLQTSKVMYVQERPTVEDLVFLKGTISSGTHIDVMLDSIKSSSQGISALQKLYFCKPIDFLGEREWRAINFGTNDYQAFSPFFLSRIIFGPSLSNVKRKRINSLITGGGVALSEVFYDRNNYKISIRDL